QLFQPGISALTERRSRIARRSGRDRRVGQAVRVMLETHKDIERVQGEPHAPASRVAADLDQTIAKARFFLHELSALVEKYESDPAGSIAGTRAQSPPDSQSHQVRHRRRAK